MSAWSSTMRTRMGFDVRVGTAPLQLIQLGGNMYPVTSTRSHAKTSAFPAPNWVLRTAIGPAILAGATATGTDDLLPTASPPAEGEHRPPPPHVVLGGCPTFNFLTARKGG